MSFRDAKQRFAAQVAVARAAVFGGSTADGTANSSGFNLQLGATQFNAAFTTLKTNRDIEEQGFRVACHGAVLIPASLGLSLSLGSQITHLPTGDVFGVVQIVSRPGHPEIRVALRKLQ